MRCVAAGAGKAQTEKAKRLRGAQDAWVICKPLQPDGLLTHTLFAPPAWGLRSLRILPRLRGMAKQDIDWEQIELDYRAGIKTLRQIAATHAISHVAIAHKAKKLGWTRDLTARIAARADEQVTAALNKTDSGKRLEAENEIVESAASALAALQIAQRRDVGKAREVVRALFDQFEQARPGLGESVRLVKQLTDSLRGVVELERQVYRMDAKEAAQPGFVPPLVQVEFVPAKGDA